MLHNFFISFTNTKLQSSFFFFLMEDTSILRMLYNYFIYLLKQTSEFLPFQLTQASDTLISNTMYL